MKSAIQDAAWPRNCSSTKPLHVPLWLDRASAFDSFTPRMYRKQAFYYDPSRDKYLLLARSRMNQAQALPNAPKFAPPLDPESCTGKWFIPSPDITEKLQELEKDMHRAWRRVERDKKDAPSYVTNKAAYLRRVFDHFLHTLHRQASKQRQRGTFNRPLHLKRIEEPNMLNALRNLAEGRDYSVGALKPPPREPTQTVAVKKEPSEPRGSSPTPESTTAGPCTSTRNSDGSQELRRSQESEISVERDNLKADYVAGPRRYSRGKRQRGDSTQILSDDEPLIKRKLGTPLGPEDSEEEEPNLLLLAYGCAQERGTSVDTGQDLDVEMVESTLVGAGVQTDPLDGSEGMAVLQQHSMPQPAAHSPEPQAFRSAAPEQEHIARVWSEEEEPDLSLQTNRRAQERRTCVDTGQDQDVEMAERTLVEVGVKPDFPNGSEGMAVLQPHSMPQPAAHSPEPQAFRPAAPEQEHLARVWSATYPMLRAVMQDMPITSEDLQPNPKKTMRLRFWETQRAQALALLERMEDAFQSAGSSESTSTAALIPHGRTFAPIRFEKT